MRLTQSWECERSALELELDAALGDPHHQALASAISVAPPVAGVAQHAKNHTQADRASQAPAATDEHRKHARQNYHG